ncbi:hypothetical protein GCM10027030_24900 [Luteococcus sediminum]
MRDLDGCDSAELYRSLAAGEDSHALTMTWLDEDSHDAFWQQVLGGEFPELWRLVATGDPVEGATEFYRCERFAPAEPQRGPVAREFYRRQRCAHHYDRWMPCDAAQVATTIVWPAS